MFWLWLWMALATCIVVTRRISIARGDKPSRALLEAIVANLIFGALLVLRAL
jgi:Na+-transporting NADH:ubiquinone oxidoreductase subunit NqrD